MTAAEYQQLKAYSRIDGLWLAVLWTVSFACYVLSFRYPGASVLAFLAVVGTPFFAARRLRLFRDNVLDGTISFLRGWGHVMLSFFYASLLFAVVQFAYFMWIDGGTFLSTLTDMFSAPEVRKTLEANGMIQTIEESLTVLRQMRPIDLSLNIMTTNMLIGVVLGLPIAAVMQRKVSGKR